ncbi:hypothetical protein [Actinomadura sp. WMMA1423]|uniref:hypothetical protein n=1 Tax=Actinomadura sp. WMMA1423 TaxID=2591108 RepID=UPI0011477288|nr:hypothetical protein [Actinomadura sp. WMMA1423]
MGFLKKFTGEKKATGERAGRRTAGRRRKPSARERRAAMRTEQAEAKLLETEALIHEEAERLRRETRTSA